MIPMNCLQAVEREAVMGGRGLHLGAVAELGGERRADVRAGRACLAGDQDRVVAALLVEQLLRGLEVEHRGGHGAERLDVAEARDADDTERAGLVARVDADAVADRVVLLLRRGGVDDDLARPGRPAAGLEAERRQLRGAWSGRVEALAEVRAVADGLAVVADDLRLVGDVPDGGLHLRHRADLGELRRGDAGPLDRVVLRVDRERGVGGHHRVRAVVGGGGQRVGRVPHRVGQREGRADHADAEHDGQRREDRADGPARQPLEGDAGHRWTASLRSSPAAPRSFSAARICSSSGEARSLTISPSARNSTRSAAAAARGSWVTMTVV